jgi:hypothetical protein
MRQIFINLRNHKSLLASATLAVSFFIFVSPYVYSLIFGSLFPGLLKDGGMATWVTTGVYSSTLIIMVATGVVIFHQAKLIRSQQRAATTIEAFKFIYDERFDASKKSCNDFYDEGLLADIDSCKVNYEKLRTIDFMITMYNNLALLIENGHLNKADLPHAFSENVVKYWERITHYIEFRRETTSSYASHFQKLYEESVRGKA